VYGEVAGNLSELTVIDNIAIMWYFASDFSATPRKVLGPYGRFNRLAA
jgi:hypothetical protein